jgi:hypothetical protein
VELRSAVFTDPRDTIGVHLDLHTRLGAVPGGVSSTCRVTYFTMHSRSGGFNA